MIQPALPSRNGDDSAPLRFTSLLLRVLCADNAGLIIPTIPATALPDGFISSWPRSVQRISKLWAIHGIATRRDVPARFLESFSKFLPGGAGGKDSWKSSQFESENLVRYLSKRPSTIIKYSQVSSGILQGCREWDRIPRPTARGAQIGRAIPGTTSQSAGSAAMTRGKASADPLTMEQATNPPNNNHNNHSSNSNSNSSSSSRQHLPLC